MRQTWILTQNDPSAELLNQFEGILAALQNGARLNESWQEPGKLVVELWEGEPG
ncbi:hypothetical protein HQN87_08200 [Paenibacillus tritici]|uniref:Uncharacterized protein n=1 Tax=Paenibacillus tritici TaxID=1873425 RepID=A0ABX2DL12_9BACL|nr:hypothetical protein [Paenibacillus tritici]NQX45311.1 hypothetical protein [Paenibacillus tritici]